MLSRWSLLSYLPLARSPPRAVMLTGQWSTPPSQTRRFSPVYPLPWSRRGRSWSIEWPLLLPLRSCADTLTYPAMPQTQPDGKPSWIA